MIKAILRSKKLITRNDGSKAYPLNEESMPKGDGTAVKNLEIIDWLDVEKSLRYKRKEISGKVVSTYCNIYAYDFCYLAGAYLPRVWWYDKALDLIKKGNSVDAKYGETVYEMNVNNLYDWFEEYGNTFGWQRQNDLKEAQDLANKGQVVIIIAKQKIATRSGHITIIAPEHQGNKARNINKHFLPLQSQAGIVNYKFLIDNWYTSPKYVGYSIYSFNTLK